MKSCICPNCQKMFEVPTGSFNRSVKKGAPIYCGRMCFGLSHRLPVARTESEEKEIKRLYDKKRRTELAAVIKQKKAEAWVRDREKLKPAMAVYRAKHMQRHVEYCRRPEYREGKKVYDKQHRAVKYFGEFAEAALLLEDITKELDALMPQIERKIINGTYNKAQFRRREL